MDNHRHRVTIIIPNYNRKRDLERLLPTIANQTFDNYEVIIIDDFSADRSAVEYLRHFVKNRRNMRLVENTENIGFVKTCNKGIKLANSEYVCILTNDTEVAANFIQRNVEIMDADNFIGVLSSVIVDKNGNNWFCGGNLQGCIPAWTIDDFLGVRSVDYVPGTACFYRREIFDKLGLFNEYLIMYHEDVEFCLRVNRSTSYKTCMFGEKLVVHNVGGGDLLSYKATYYMHRSLILVSKKYRPKCIPRILSYYSREMANVLLVSVFKLNPKHLLYMASILKGTVDGLIDKV